MNLMEKKTSKPFRSYQASPSWLTDEQKEAVEALHRRDREAPGMFLSGRELFWFFAKLLFWGALGWLFVFGFLAL